MRNNASHAGNQQERLIMIGWIVGFVDAEGCFSINFIKQPDRQERNRMRKGYKTGYQVAYEFAVVQGAKSLKSLEKIRDFFGIGNIYINKRYDNHKEHLYRYCVRKRDDLRNVIVPFFKEHKLQTSKRYDFDQFVRCLNLIEKGEHLTKNGLIKIARITETMNHKKPKTDLFRILRNQTSDFVSKKQRR
ncbi:LAGLIDADG family homing endonuclease [Candidatus Azambacteria bacterium]|nr:LAGLIDADG family homing endonuclease [Candidatus Azambacteria bacterium]